MNIPSTAVFGTMNDVDTFPVKDAYTVFTVEQLDTEHNDTVTRSRGRKFEPVTV